MDQDEKAYWSDKLAIYSSEEWSNRPSIFAETAKDYFPEQGKLLEIGSGLGQDGVWFASEGYDIVQSDVIDIGFAHAKKLADEWHTTVSQQVLDLWQDLPFEDESLDIVYAHLSLHYFPEQRTQEIFREIHRVLKPGGILAALFNSTSDPEYGQGEQIEADYFQVGKLRKRFLSIDSAKSFAKDFETLLLDDEGMTYKDQAKGIHNLIRLIASKKS